MDEPWAPSSEVDMSKAFGILRRSQRFTLLMGMVALLTLGFLAIRPPDAAGDGVIGLKPQTCTYYSDTSYSTIVGYRGYHCNNSVLWESGTITSYRICDYDYCCAPGPYWC
jgi:hypothetical protein